MRHALAMAGWSEVAVPVDAWWGADREGRPVTLSYVDGDQSGPAAIPATNEDGSVCVALAGSIYNARELRATLARDHALKGGDDAEVVAHLYEERDLHCMQALRGAFAVMLWDNRRRRLLLARDQLGLVPLYYVAEARRCAAASALPWLARLPGQTDAVDLAALDAFLALGVVPPPATVYPGIRQLHPAEVLVWEDGRIRGRRYWQLSFPERRVGEGAVPGVLRDGLVEALRLRQAGAVPGLLLSGGLGASTVLTLALADQRPPARAYTVAGADLDPEDGRLAGEIARAAGVEHVVVEPPTDWGATLDALLATHAGPVGNIEAALLYDAVVRAGGLPSVVLAGTGGDEVFGGSLPVRTGERVRHFRDLPAVVRESAEMLARIAPRRWAERFGHLVHHGRLAPVEMYARTVSRFLPEERDELYSPDTVALLGESSPWTALSALFPEAVAAGGGDPADAIHYVELALRLPARVAALRAAVPTLDLRFPLADHRVASLVASLTPADRGTSRARQVGLRRALATTLPRQVLRRPHVAPVPTRAAWTSGSLRALVEETLAPARVAAQGVFRPETVDRLVQAQLAGRGDDGARLWSLLVVSRWLERQRRPAVTSLRAAG